MNTERVLEEMTAKPGFLLSRVGTAIQLGFKELLAGHGLRPLEFLILQLLGSGDGASQQQLCRAAGVDSGNMVEFVDTLERLGDATRTRDPADRRRYIVTITPTGRSRAAQIVRDLGAYDERFLSPLSDAERRRLVATLGKLYATIPEARERPPASRR